MMKLMKGLFFVVCLQGGVSCIPETNGGWEAIVSLGVHVLRL